MEPTVGDQVRDGEDGMEEPLIGGCADKNVGYHIGEDFKVGEYDFNFGEEVVHVMCILEIMVKELWMART